MMSSCHASKVGLQLSKGNRFVLCGFWKFCPWDFSRIVTWQYYRWIVECRGTVVNSACQQLCLNLQNKFFFIAMALTFAKGHDLYGLFSFVFFLLFLSQIVRILWIVKIFNSRFYSRLCWTWIVICDIIINELLWKDLSNWWVIFEDFQNISLFLC